MKFWVLGVESPFLKAVVEWNKFFDAELDLIREAHYLVSNGIPIEDEQLEAAVKVARQILSILIDKLQAIGVSPEVWKEFGSTKKAREEAAKLRTERMERARQKAAGVTFHISDDSIKSEFTGSSKEDKEDAKADKTQADK